MIRILTGIVILLIGVLAGILLVGFSPIGMITYEGKQSLTSEDLLMIPYLSLEGFSEVAVGMGDVDSENAEIYLYSGCRRIVMLTNDYQANSIKNGLEGILDIRPNTHDIMKNVFETFGMEPIMVKITHLDNGAYFARLFLVQGTRVLNLDTRPTDAIAIAVRSGAPVFVNQVLLEEHGEKVC